MARLAVEDLIQALKSKSPVDRWQAARRLTGAAQVQQMEVLAALADALEDEHPFVRWCAGSALVRAGRAQAMATLIDRLENGSRRQQAAAADALAYARKVNAEPLLHALDSKDALVRRSAAEALGRLGFRQAVPRLIGLLTDESPWVRRASARALGHIGDQNAVGLLCQLLGDESPLVRGSAAYALGAMRVQDALPALIMVLDDPDPHVRRNAAWALGRIRDRAALPKLRELRIDLALDGDVADQAEIAIRAIEHPRWRWLPAVIGPR